jgi:hypothetical protein
MNDKWIKDVGARRWTMAGGYVLEWAGTAGYRLVIPGEQTCYLVHKRAVSDAQAKATALSVIVSSRRAAAEESANLARRIVAARKG